MTDGKRRSTLQMEILGVLRDRDAPTITALAGELDRSRPSVSRSLHALLDQGLVDRDGSIWRITQSGRSSLDQAIPTFRSTTEDIIETTGSRIRAAANLGIGDGFASMLEGSLGLRRLADIESSAMRLWAVEPTSPFLAALHPDRSELEVTAAAMAEPALMLSIRDGSPATVSAAMRSLDELTFGQVAPESLIDMDQSAAALGNFALEIENHLTDSGPSLASSMAASSAKVMAELEFPGGDASSAVLNANHELGMSWAISALADGPTFTMDHLIEEGVTAIQALSSCLADVGTYNAASTALMDHIPDVTHYFEDFERAGAAAEALAIGGPDHPRERWSIGVMRELAEFPHPEYSPTALPIAEYTPQLSESLEVWGDVFFGSPLTACRWPVIRAAFEDHERGRYVSSIPVLLTQIEGVITDILVFMGKARIDGTQTRLICDDGSLGKSLNGLQAKSKQASMWLDRAVASQIAAAVAPSRNGILHGVTTNYGQAALSTQYMRILVAVANTLIGLEQDH